MRRAGSIFAIIGAIGIALIVALVIRFGATNMRRVEAESSAWRMSWMSRR